MQYIFYDMTLSKIHESGYTYPVFLNRNLLEKDLSHYKGYYIFSLSKHLLTASERFMVALILTRFVHVFEINT